MVLVVTGTYYFVLPHGASTTVTIVATAGSQEEGVAFTPANFTVKEGQRVTLVLDNKDVYPHELQIPEFGVNTGVVQGGQTGKVSFVPHKAGTFGFGQVASYCIAGPAPNCPVLGLDGNMTVSSA
jgi:heme/copper-type cytochrome/quinol oxidase subunit 2